MVVWVFYFMNYTTKPLIINDFCFFPSIKTNPHLLNEMTWRSSSDSVETFTALHLMVSGAETKPRAEHAAALQISCCSSAPFRAPVSPGFCVGETQNMQPVVSREFTGCRWAKQCDTDHCSTVYSVLHRSQKEGGGRLAEPVNSSSTERKSGNMENVTGLDTAGEL